MKSLVFASVLLIAAPSFADWAGLLEGEGKTVHADYNNCDIRADFRFNKNHDTFEIANLDYSCALANKTLYQSFNEISAVIGAGGKLTVKDKVIGTMSATDLDLTLKQNGSAHFHFSVVPDTAALDVKIKDDSGETITGRIW